MKLYDEMTDAERKRLNGFMLVICVAFLFYGMRGSAGSEEFSPVDILFRVFHAAIMIPIEFYLVYALDGIWMMDTDRRDIWKGMSTRKRVRNIIFHAIIPWVILVTVGTILFGIGMLTLFMATYSTGEWGPELVKQWTIRHYLPWVIPLHIGAIIYGIVAGIHNYRQYRR